MTLFAARVTGLIRNRIGVRGGRKLVFEAGKDGPCDRDMREVHDPGGPVREPAFQRDPHIPQPATKNRIRELLYSCMRLLGS